VGVDVDAQVVWHQHSCAHVVQWLLNEYLQALLSLSLPGTSIPMCVRERVSESIDFSDCVAHSVPLRRSHTRCDVELGERWRVVRKIFKVRPLVSLALLALFLVPVSFAEP